MANLEKFTSTIQQGYTFEQESLVLGGAMLDKTAVNGLQVKIPFKMLNRHGLIAGATGTGKTKTLQSIAEQLSANSVPVLLMDIKGDLSGIGVAGSPNPKAEERAAKIGIPMKYEGSPVEFLTLSNEKGARLRATVTEFGPVLFSKILGLNDTQSGAVSVVFKYCDDKQLPLLDLKDFKKTLQYISEEGKDEISAEYGQIATATVGIIIRKVLELEQQGAEVFFGDPSFDVQDLCRIDTSTGKGMVSIIRLTDIQDRPKLFSTFMLSMLAEIYDCFPEAGDIDRPKLVLFIDEAHLVFQEASQTLLDQLEAIIKLIRSKGIGIVFITQSPDDIPESILGQLGMKIQHALRAFTAKDRKAIKLAAENYPDSEFYTINELITEMGIGEAFVSVLNTKGIPTPLVHTLMRPPQSRMDVLTDSEIDGIISRSHLARKYNVESDPQSAYEILSAKIAAAQDEANQEQLRKEQEKAAQVTTGGRGREEKSIIEQVATSTAGKQVFRTIAREVTRGLLGMLGFGGKRR